MRPMSDVVTLRSLRELAKITSAYAVEDRRRSWIAVLSTVGLLLAAAAIVIAPVPLPVRLAGGVATSLLVMRMFVLYHDFEHGAILGRSRAARLLMSSFGVLILGPPSIWNRLHNYHHAQNCRFATSGIGSFPVMTVDEYRRASRRERLAYRALRSPVLLAAAYLTVFMVGFCVKPVYDRGRRHRDSIVALAIHVVLLIVYLRVGWDTLLIGLIGPMWCAHATCAYVFYAQHNFPGVRLQPGDQWDYVHAAIHSSSFIDGSRFMHWVTANIGYHGAHHLNARIPFYRLPEATAAIDELRQAVTTTLRFRDIRACVALKLWDEQAQRMTGYPVGPQA
jgi:acyl-lipid omega-6 desaturase (Delta-12 desaturase)